MTAPLSQVHVGNDLMAKPSNHRNLVAASMSSNDSAGSRGSRKQLEPVENEMKPYENITGYRQRKIDQSLSSQGKLSLSQNLQHSVLHPNDKEFTSKTLTKIQLSKVQKG